MRQGACCEQENKGDVWVKHTGLLALLLAAAIAVTAAGCKDKGGKEEPQGTVSSSAPEPVDRNFPVSIGEIRIPERPERIVSLSPALTEVLCELGAESRLAGVSDFCDYPQSVEGLDRCGSASLPNFEAIAALSPDVVFTSAPLAQADAVRLQQMGAEVVVLGRADSLEALSEVYETAATILDGMEDGAENGQTVFGGLRAGYDALKARADNLSEPLGGILLREPPLLMATGDTFEGELLEWIGVENDAAEFTGWVYPSDKAVDLYPDLIFYDQSIDPSYFQSTPVYSTTGAFQNGRLYPVDMTAFERQSGRMLDELTHMFESAYPEG